MHEIGLMQEAMGIAERCARREGASRILRLALRVGEQSGVVPEALEFAFEALTPGSMADGARLEILPVPVVCHCAECDSEFLPEGPFYVCPRCGALSANIRSGRDLEVAAIETE